MKKAFLLFLFLLTASGIYSQEADITSMLKAIDSGDIETAQSGLKRLKTSQPGDPSVIYLDALLSSDGKTALLKYQKVAQSFPKSRYADAAVWRIYSYYYASGLYNTAQKYYDELKEKYPSSDYLNNQESTIHVESNQIETDQVKTEVPVISGTKEVSEADKVYNYTIQGGAFLLPENARKLKNTFENAGYFSEVKQKKVGGSTFSIVYIGRFETEEDAKTFLTDLNKRQKIEGRIVHIE